MTSLRHLHDVYISVLGSQNSFAAPAGADWFRRVVAHGHVFMNGDYLLNNTRTYFCPRILLHIISFQCTLLVNLKSVLPKPIIPVWCHAPAFSGAFSNCTRTYVAKWHSPSSHVRRLERRGGHTVGGAISKGAGTLRGNELGHGSGMAANRWWYA